jgi:23S rRNA pseudouridine1911/1915/1917 synthase
MMTIRRSEAADYSRALLAIPAEYGGLRLDAALARLFPEHSRSRLQAWVKEGRVTVDGAAADAKRKVIGGERVALLAAPPADGLAAQGEDIALDIVFEDPHLLVIDKPAGLVVHPGSGNWSGTLMNALLHHWPPLGELPRAGIVHRLDKDTTGLLVVAKTLPAQTDLVRQLQARSVSRRYLALVHGTVAAGGRVDKPIGRHPVQRTKMAVVSGGGREARTDYEVRERFAAATLLECRLETGRTHQIRVHMASLGHPLVGDATYGRRTAADPRLAAFNRQALHAWRLALRHPQDGRERAWEAPVPADFAALLAGLRDG